MNVTLSRGSTSLDLPLLDEGGNPLFSTDFGKPFANIRDTGGSVNPRAEDRWSAQINHTINGRFDGSNAFQNARTLANLIKQDPGGNDLELTTGFAEFSDPLLVTPQAGNEQALTLTYEPGRTDTVFFQLGLTEVSVTRTQPDRTFSTPTASGSGPIELTASGNTVTLAPNISVERSVGRPNDSATKTLNELGRYIYKHKVTYDQFSLSFEMTENLTTQLKTIADTIFKQRLDRDGITLDFNGLYGYGAFTVLPTGSAPIRYQRLAGRTGQVTLPTIDLRVIRPTTRV
jgi:hypothetical protein